MALLGALDNITVHPVAGTLGALWGVGGVLGAIGAWLIIFDGGCGTIRTRRLVIFLVGAGIASASVLLIHIPQQLFRASSRHVSASEITFALCLLAAVSIGVFQICRVSSASPRMILGSVATAYLIGIGFLAAEPLYTNVIQIERLVRWDCWDPARCDEDAGYIKYSFPGGSAWFQMKASNALLAHLKGLRADEVTAKLRVQTRFGRFESFTIVELGGFPIDDDATNSNQPEPPFPTPGVDDHVDASGT
jgi:hypothetical protein